MGEKLKKFSAKGKELAGKMSKKVKILLIIVLVLAVGAIAAVAIINSSRPYTVLFSDLSSADMASILTYLDSAGYKDYLTENGNTILVRENQAQMLQAKVLQQGYPTSGYLHTTYTDMVGTLSSDADRVQASIFDKQEYLGAMLGEFDGVKRATVSITLAEDDRYILSTEEKTEASAFVVLEMEQGKKLTQQQVQMMMIGVAHSVEGLTVDNVAITDLQGTPYSINDETTDAQSSADLKLSLERTVNANIRNQVLTVLSPIYGLENLSVSVNTTVDVSRSWVDDTHYSQPDWASEGVDGTTGSKGIIGKFVWDDIVVRGDEDTVGGIPGTTTNSDYNDLHEYITDPDNINGDESELHSAGELYFDNNVTHTQQEIPAGRIVDITVSVAVNSTNVTVPDSMNVVELVASASGIDKSMMSDKITVMVAPFYVEPKEPVEPEPGVEPEPEPESPLAFLATLPLWMILAIGGGLLLLIILLIVFLIIRHRIRKKKKKALEEAAAAEEARLQAEQAALAALAGEPTQGADIMDLHTESSMELRREVREFAENNPEIAAQMVKNWLKGEEQHG